MLIIESMHSFFYHTNLIKKIFFFALVTGKFCRIILINPTKDIFPNLWV